MNSTSETSNISDQDLFGDPIIQRPASPPKKRDSTVVEVDPQDCVIWSHNPRNQEHVNEATTLSLAESILASGRQQVLSLIHI